MLTQLQVVAPPTILILLLFMVGGAILMDGGLAQFLAGRLPGDQERKTPPAPFEKAQRDAGPNRKRRTPAGSASACSGWGSAVGRRPGYPLTGTGMATGFASLNVS